MERAAKLDVPVIFAIGNAPTALIELDRLMREQDLKPELIIGVPVGFVNVVESKELILQSQAPHIVARGRKGNRLFKKAGAPREFFAPALEPMLYQKNLFSFCLLSCWLLENVMHGFSFTKRASAQKYARPRWLFYKFALHHHSPFIHYCFFWGTKVWRVGAGKSAPPFMECCIKIAPLQSRRAARISRGGS